MQDDPECHRQERDEYWDGCEVLVVFVVFDVFECMNVCVHDVVMQLREMNACVCEMNACV